MKYMIGLLTMTALLWVPFVSSQAAAQENTTQIMKHPKIISLVPAEQGFFSQELLFHGIPIKASAVVSRKRCTRRMTGLLWNFGTCRPWSRIWRRQGTAAYYRQGSSDLGPARVS